MDRYDRELTGDGNGRRPDGRFGPGNKLGKGNPLAGRAAQIRAVLLRKLTPKAAGRIADKLIAQASDGDLAAIRELLDRTIGKPGAAEIVERIEALERATTGEDHGLREQTP
jgi:hypothetical protein